MEDEAIGQDVGFSGDPGLDWALLLQTVLVWLGYAMVFCCIVSYLVRVLSGTVFSLSYNMRFALGSRPRVVHIEALCSVW